MKKEKEEKIMEKQRQHFKLRSRRKGNQIFTTVFSGIEGHTLANTGMLVQNIGEWQLFGALLKIGSEANNLTKRDSLVTFEGDEEVVNI